MESGTAFSVGADGTMVTAGHLVVGPDGSDPPMRIAVQFSGTYRVLPAELIAVAPEDDLAILRVPGIGARGVTSILASRQYNKLRDLSDLKAIGVNANRPAPFVLLDGRRPSYQLRLF